MKIALFAAEAVGKEVALFLGEQREPITCVVVDSADRKGLNREIVASSKVSGRHRIFESETLDHMATQQALRALDLDLILLAWWPYILKPDIIEIPRLGCLNFHPSLLPYNRGKHYNFWTLVEDTPFGVTLHWVNGAIDAGDIAWQSPIEKSWTDTGETLYHRAQREIVKLFREKFADIQRGAIPRVPQDLARGSAHRAAEIEPASKIDLERPYTARELLNLIRARTFPPHPGAWFLDGGEKYEVRIEIKKVTDART